jgi:hypothetical protein
MAASGFHVHALHVRRDSFDCMPGWSLALQFERTLEAYRRASKQWSATLNRFAEGSWWQCTLHMEDSICA